MELNQWPLHYPFAEQASLCFEREKKSIYCWTRSRPTWTFGESDDQVRDKSESKYQRVQDKSETIEKRPRPDSSTTALPGTSRDEWFGGLMLLATQTRVMACDLHHKGLLALHIWKWILANEKPTESQMGNAGLILSRFYFAYARPIFLHLHH